MLAVFLFPLMKQQLIQYLRVKVNISLRVLSRPMEEKLPTIYKTLGVDFDDRVLPSIGNEVLKAVVAHYNAEELLSKRALVSSQINDALIKRAATFNLILDDVSITHLTFGREVTFVILCNFFAEYSSSSSQTKINIPSIVRQGHRKQTSSTTRSRAPDISCAEGRPGEEGCRHPCRGRSRSRHPHLQGHASSRQRRSIPYFIPLSSCSQHFLTFTGNGLIEVRRIDAAVEVANTLAKSKNITYLPSGGGGSGGGSNIMLKIDPNSP
jgi:prohibitin 1